MSKNKCSFCHTEETDRIYWHSEITTACMCGNCSVQFARSVLEQREQANENDSNDKSNLDLSGITASYQYLKQINLGSIAEEYEDLIECMHTPTILILSSEGYESNLVILGNDEQKIFDDIYDAYAYCAEFLARLKIADLTQEKILGLITSANDEDEDGMYATLQNEGGEVLFSQSIDIQTLREEAEDSLNNTDLFDMPFCLVQYTDSANINIDGGTISVNGSDIELSEITDLPGYMDNNENKVCVYVT